MPLRLDNARALPTCPQQQTKKTFKPRFKIDHAASPMPETNRPERLAPGRHQIGMVGEIISESWARSNRYTRARSSESADRKTFARSEVFRVGPGADITLATKATKIPQCSRLLPYRDGAML